MQDNQVHGNATQKVHTSNCEIRAFSKHILKQMIAFNGRKQETFPCTVRFVCSDPCAELGEVDVWDSFSVSNTVPVSLL